MKIKRYLSFFVILNLLTSCNNFKEISKSFFSFSTLFEIKAYNIEEEKLYKLEALIEKYNKLFDAYNEYEGIVNIYTINHTNEEIEVSSELFEALIEANSYYVDSSGYFNPYIGEITYAYKDAYASNSLPSEEEINKYLLNLKDFVIEFEEENYTVKRSGESLLDLGAFAKGYVLKKVNELASSLNINYYFVNAGSSSSYFTIKPNNEEFLVGIKYLNSKALKVSNASIGVSSIFEQYIEIDNNIYSHIINPFTGLSETKYDFSLIKSSDPIISDVFSTVYMILDDIELMDEFAKRFDFSYSIFKDSEEIYSSDDLEYISY